LVGPTVVFEVTSQSTYDEDDVFKPPIYAQIGVKEYFMFDPDGGTLDPSIKGRRLADGRFEAIEPDAGGRLMSRELGLLLEVDGPLLRAVDPRTGQRLMSSQEIADANDELRSRVAQMESDLDDARRKADAEKRRAAKLEEELKRLRGANPT
jgi:hypothetical protein